MLDRDLDRVTLAAISRVPLRAITKAELANETAKDPHLPHLIRAIQGENWNPEDSDGRVFKKLMNEFTYDTENGIVLRGAQIVVPTSIQSQVLQLAHEGHMGPERVKSRIRQSFWFPGIESKVDQFIASCEPCAVNRPKEPHPPMKTLPMPGESWHVLAADFCGPTPSGTYLLLAVDEHSRYPFVVEVHSTGFKPTKRALDNLFAMFGAPKIVKTDNGPPFNGQDFAEFLKDYGVKHQKSTPIWPQSNGMVERLVRSVKKSIRSALAAGATWKQQLPEFLMAYRNTPHSSTGVSPAQLLLGRPLRDKLTVVEEVKTSTKPVVKGALSRDERRKAYNKAYADNNRHAKSATISKGQQVLVRPDRKPTSFAPRYEPKPYEVTAVKGTMVTAQRDGKMVTRNVSWFTPAPDVPRETERQAQPEGDESLPATSGASSPSGGDGQLQNSSPTVTSRPTRERRRPRALEDYVLTMK